MRSWSIPFSVMMVVPLGVIGALLAASLRGLTNDVYFQVGLLTTIGLAAKNAILIVEFAKEQQEHGKELIAATMEAVRMRLRPILMTSLAFILGILPVISHGAGSGSQNAIGTGVMGGMISATVLAIFLVPVFFVVVRRRFPPKNWRTTCMASARKVCNVPTHQDFSLGVLASALAGCSLIPVYQQPASPVAAQWPPGRPIRVCRQTRPAAPRQINWPGSNFLPTRPCSS
jgi:predicted RND superfamily exporter protein